MATLTIQIVSGLGTSSKVLTFSSTDAGRIFTAYQNQVQPGGTQDQMAAWLASQAQRLLVNIVSNNETTTPTPPVIT